VSRANSYWFYQGAYAAAHCADIRAIFENNPCRDLADIPAETVHKRAQVVLCRWYKVRHLLGAAHDVALWFNRHHIGFDVFPMTDLDAVHLNTYTPPDGEYGWHQDATAASQATDIKLTVLVNVSTEAYTGGELSLFQQGVEPVAEMGGQGAIVVFPGWIPHRVSPVTGGRRSTISFWLTGPRLR
jgi:PKHD-type hydroxylase